MKRILAFADRNRKELLRDPLSYIFCLAFPLVMLGVMTLVNASIPKEAGMTVFRIDNLSAGVAVFGQTFIMLFTGLTVSKDRSGAFLTRMYVTPMTSGDFVLGYILPMLIISLCQSALIFIASLLISLIVDFPLSVGGLICSWLTLIPSALMFIGLGLLFGTLFGEKAAPGICSIIISLGSFLGCIWFDAESTGGVLLTVCRALPFYYCTKSSRSAVHLDLSFSAWGGPLLIVIACAALIGCTAVLTFKNRMKADLG